MYTLTDCNGKNPVEFATYEALDAHVNNPMTRPRIDARVYIEGGIWEGVGAFLNDVTEEDMAYA